MSSRVSKELIQKLQAVRDGYEAIGEYNNSTIDKLIQQNLNELRRQSNLNGDMGTAAWCNKELDKEKMSHRLRRAVSLVPSGILDPRDDRHSHRHSHRHIRHSHRNSHDRVSNFRSQYQWNPIPEGPLPDYLQNFSEPINPFSGNPSQFPEYRPSSGGKTRKMKGKKGKKSIRRRKN